MLLYRYLLLYGLLLHIMSQNLCLFSLILQGLHEILDYYSLFWGPEEISIVVEAQGALTVGHQHWQFWPILARFMDYHSLF